MLRSHKKPTYLMMSKESRYPFLSRPLIWLFRCLLCLRYRVRVNGLKDVHRKSDRPVLFLPNHPALIDPLLIASHIWKRRALRALVVEKNFNIPILKWFYQWLNAFSIPGLKNGVTGSDLRRAKNTFAQVRDEIRKGGSYLIYPSGMLKRSHGIERIGGASFVHDLLKEVPDVDIYLVRTKGVWGSQSSWALQGKSPKLIKLIFKYPLMLLGNLLLFCPRRKVTIEVEKAPVSLTSELQRSEFNKHLEDWYNRGYGQEGEPISLVKEYFWSSKLPEITHPQQDPVMLDGEEISGEYVDAAISVVADAIGKPKEEVELDKHLSLDYNLDSFELTQLFIALSEKLGTMDEFVPGEISTVCDLAREAYKHLKISKQIVEKQSLHRAWGAEMKRPPHVLPEATSTVEAFLKTCQTFGAFSACADEMIGARTFRQCKIAVIALASEMRKLKAERIGIMLPASATVNLLIFAAQLAGKVPVMINWTAGKRSLQDAISSTELEVILSSQRFLDKLLIDLPIEIEERLVTVENLRASIGLGSKLCALWNARMKPLKLIKKMAGRTYIKDDHAVILFTSGTESLPKKVPLSHKNILANIQAVMDIDAFKDPVTVLSILPPFHSFGFTITGIMPLVTGMRAIFSPDPTKSLTLIRAIEKWKPTVTFTAPMFFLKVLERAKPEQLSSFNLVVSGAEKAPKGLKSKVEAVGATFLEGYGITECSPVVTCNRPGKPQRGVGLPLPGIDVQVIDNEGNVLPPSCEGEIIISGDTVFGGYLGDQSTPLIQIADRLYYKSGDKGLIDQEGYLILSGRLKRFIKVHGEMVSLGGLEHDLNEEFKGRGAQIVLVGLEQPCKKPSIHLFCTVDSIPVEEFNSFLRKHGYASIITIDKAHYWAGEIPLTSTGKVSFYAFEQVARNTK